MTVAGYEVREGQIWLDQWGTRREVVFSFRHSIQLCQPGTDWHFIIKDNYERYLHALEV